MLLLNVTAAKSCFTEEDVIHVVEGLTFPLHGGDKERDEIMRQSDYACIVARGKIKAVLWITETIIGNGGFSLQVASRSANGEEWQEFPGLPMNAEIPPQYAWVRGESWPVKMVDCDSIPPYTGHIPGPPQLKGIRIVETGEKSLQIFVKKGYTVSVTPE